MEYCIIINVMQREKKTIIPSTFKFKTIINIKKYVWMKWKNGMSFDLIFVNTRF